VLVANSIVPAALTANYAAAVLADSPVGYWPLNEASGTVALDASGNGHDGTYSGSFTLGASGLLPASTNTCVNFTGGRMAVPDAVALRLGAGALSVEAWINASSMASYASLWDDGTSGATRGYSLFLNANGGGGPTRVYAEFGGSGDPSNEIAISTGIATNETDHVVVTSNGLGAIVIYRNAVSVFSRPNQVIGAANSANGVTLFGNPSGGGGLLQGKAQSFAVYGSVLTPARVTAHYNAGVGSSPAAWLAPLVVAVSGRAASV